MRIFLACILFVASTVEPAELLGMQFEHEDRFYQLHLHARLGVPAEQVKSIITDYDHLDRVNPFLKESRVERRNPDKSTQMRLITESCIWFICFEIRHDQLFEPMRGSRLLAHIIPEHSDFHSGHFSWTLRANGTETDIYMEAIVEPAFIVPPVIGPYLLEKKLGDIALGTLRNIERIAATTDQETTIDLHELHQPVEIATRSGHSWSRE